MISFDDPNFGIFVGLVAYPAICVAVLLAVVAVRDARLLVRSINKKLWRTGQPDPRQFRAVGPYIVHAPRGRS